MDKKEKRKRLVELKEKMEKDESLPLKKQANKLVFGEGNADADILFVGEGPGRWEDEKGRPFVGNAGALLNQLLYSVELERKGGFTIEGGKDEVFITNIIHYRPPNNRDPSPEEISAFGKYLDQMIEIIDPKIIVTLGRFSMGKFLPGVKIGSVHGKPKKVEWKGKKLTIVPMYHPAAGLRNGEFKRRLKEDFKKMTEILEDIDKAGIEGQETVEDKSEQMPLV